MSFKATQVQMVARPSGAPRIEHFCTARVTLPSLIDGQVLIENLWMSVDPYMRRSMDAAGKDLAPWPLDGALDGPCVGRVLESRNDNFLPGDIVESMSGWQSHFISNGDTFVPYLTPNNGLAKRPRHIDAKDFVGLLGMASFTAYAAMCCLNPCTAGHTVVISSGAGTVGSLACQMGIIQGLRVVSSAGSDEKVRWLKEEIGVAEAFNYRHGPLGGLLAAACPEGIDLLLENASPEHFSACLPLMNELATMLIAGFVSIYSSGGKIANLPNFECVLDRFLSVKAYRFMDHLYDYDRFVSLMLAWRSEGRIRLRETLYEGLDAAPAAFCDLMDGRSSGRTLVRLAE